MFKLPFKIEINREPNPKNSLNWKVFWMTFIAMFIVTALKSLGIRPPQLISPIPIKADIFDKIRPKLDEKKNTYQLKTHPTFIEKAYADSVLGADSTTAYVVTDFQTGEILAGKRINSQVPIASLTKIMTAVVALDLATPSELFPVSKKAENEIPSKIGVLPSDKLTLEELLNGMLLMSGNDAAEVIREGIDANYGDTVFIKAMNQKAALIGLKHTHFTNPQGFDNPYNYSSAEDLAVLTHYALTSYPLLASIVKKSEERIPATSNHPHDFKLLNWNGLLGVYPNISGVKIGNTEQAGTTTVVTSQRGGKTILAVLLGAPGILERDLWASQLLDFGFQESLGLLPVSITEEQLREKYHTWYE